MGRQWLIIFITALGPIIWGSTYIVTSQVLPEGKPFISAFIRGAPAGLLLILISWSFPKRSEFAKLCVLGFLNIGCFQAMLFIAAYRLPGGLAAVIGAIQPLIVIGLLWGLEKKRLGWRSVTCGVVSVVGMGLLILSSNNALDSIGILAAFIGALSMGTGTYCANKWCTSMSVIGLTGWQLLLGSLLLLPFIAWLDWPLPTLSKSQLYAYLYLSLFGAVVAYFLWFNGIKRLSPVAVSALGLLSPLTASLLGWIFAGEFFSEVAWLGFFLVLASVLYMQTLTRKS